MALTLAKIANWFPVVQIVLSILAAIAYSCARDWGRAAYWGSASILTTSITFWIKH